MPKPFFIDYPLRVPQQNFITRALYNQLSCAAIPQRGKTHAIVRATHFIGTVEIGNVVIQLRPGKGEPISGAAQLY